MPTDHRRELKKIRRFDQLIVYLRDEMGWPIARDSFDSVDDLFYDFTPEELGIDTKSAAKIQEIKRLRPLSTHQPWGIFFVKFEPKQLPVVALRRILSQVALKKRSSANSAERAAWSADDLLFVSNYGEGETRQISFAHFSQNAEKNDLPTLKVLGWNNLDTALHLDDVSGKLTQRLVWPDDEEDAERWRKRWRSAFTLEHRQVINTSKALSVELARLARNIRDCINTVLSIETEEGPVSKLMAAFKKSLVHDLDQDGFADMYAQTIAYGLLSARVANPSGDTADGLATTMPVTNPFLKELMETFLHVGGRKSSANGGAGIDFDELGVSEVVELLDAANMEAVVRDFGDRNPQEDPVIHFYELFLKEYDAGKRMQRGVFYTPRPVVSFIVRSVDELLRIKFGLDDGLADITSWGEMTDRFADIEIPEGASADQAFVQILDPATGTGTFLVEVIAVIFRTMTEKWQAEGHGRKTIGELWNDYVPQHLLPRLHGYELMMAPYAIAHMKVGLKLYETGYQFQSDQRARVYLTNSLEPPHDFSDTLAFAIPALAHEAEEVNSVKRDRRFTVVIGNPPYAHLSSNLTPDAMASVEPYKFVDGERLKERGALSLQKNLQDDYIKFIRLSESMIESSALGIVGIISNNSYLDSRSFRGMRFHLSQSFSNAWILDLHGSGKKDEHVDGDRDENVFEIMQGVAISIFLQPPHQTSRNCFKRADILGSRGHKYQFLSSASFDSVGWDDLQLASPFFLFDFVNLRLLNEYQDFVSLKDIFDVYSSGVKTHRDNFAYSFSADETQEKIRNFCDLTISDDSVRSLYGLKDTNVWKMEKKRRSADKVELRESICAALYRPFDIRWTCFSDDIIELTRRAVMDQMQGGNNLALLCSGQQAEEGFFHVFCTRLISDWGAVSNKTRESTSAFPLFITVHSDSASTQSSFDMDSGRDRNLSHTWTGSIGSSEGTFFYLYALLHSQQFRARYAAFLRTDFPRIPKPPGGKLQEEIIKLGAELVALHLLESPILDEYLTNVVGPGDLQVDKVSYSSDTVWLDKPLTRGFQGVTEEVWNFRIGGYQVCEKWLKDRQTKGGKIPRPGRVLSDEEMAHYQRIVVAISQTIRVMGKIDQVIDQYGGWPVAFINSEQQDLPKVAEDAIPYDESSQ